MNLLPEVVKSAGERSGQESIGLSQTFRSR